MSESFITLLVFALSVGVASAFCSLAEASIVGLSDIGVKKLKKTNEKKSNILSELLNNRSKYMSSVIMMNTIINVGGSMFVGTAAAQTLPFQGTAIKITYGMFVGTLTLMMLLFSEIKPKIYAAQNPEKVALAIHLPLRLITKVLTPLVNAINGLLNNTDKSSNGSMGVADIEHLIGMAHESGALRKAETDLVINALNMGRKTAGEIVKEESILKMNVGDKAEDHKEQLLASQHKKIVLVNHLDQPVGVALKEDVFASLINADGRLFSDMMHHLPVISENHNLSCTAKEIQGAPVKLIAITNENGCLTGVVGMSDIKEALFGNY